MADVVTSFIMHDGKVLIVKRSPSMLSYPSRWGAISGSVEMGEDLLSAAYREIREETGISPDTLEFVARIPSFTISDGSHLWDVHSFLFKSETAEVSINEENSAYSWILPEEMQYYDIVPGLYDAFHA